MEDMVKQGKHAMMLCVFEEGCGERLILSG
jgi:hypothetical protein